MSVAAKFREAGRKIICVGRNYGAHAAELGNPVPEKPILFFKPTSSYLSEGSPIQIPKGCSSLHHEVELGIIIERTGKNISESSALDHVGGYILALDMTARDFQDEAKKKGQPWAMAKGFDTSCPVSGFIPREKVQDPQNVNLWCKVICPSLSSQVMKVVAVLLAVLVVAYAAPAPEKRFIISDIKHAISSIGHGFSHLWDSAKSEFHKLASHINFDSVVAKLVPLIDSSRTESGCQHVCVGAASSVLGPVGSLAGSLCKPACKAALAKLENAAG